ncbi:uncharacterized protein METZ01_LOCUS221826, partial [marine metagenome]
MQPPAVTLTNRCVMPTVPSAMFATMVSSDDA